MKPYIRKYELVKCLSVERTTLSRWIRYFEEFIPLKQFGDVECYGVEAKEILLKVKSLREQLYSLPHIREILSSEGYSKYDNPK